MLPGERLAENEFHDQVCRYLVEKYGDPIDCGRTRMAFGNAFVVVKLPLLSDLVLGSRCNVTEARTWRRDDTIKKARCRLIKTWWFDLLVMERVNPKVLDKDRPEWGNWIDCAQYGYNRAGQVVAYDFA